MSEFHADADATPSIYYYAVVRNEKGERVSNCQHSHYTREAAEHCAESWLLPQFVSKFKTAAHRSAR